MSQQMTTGRDPITPLEALELLKEGNRRFLDDAPYNPPMDRLHRLHLAAAQQPFAAYLSCSDSRVPPELLFERGLGELFIVRNAGNTLCATALGSLEFAVTQLQVPLIVVMGHEACGAIRAAVSVARGRRPIPATSRKCCNRCFPRCSKPTPGQKTSATPPPYATCAGLSGNCGKKPLPPCLNHRPPAQSWWLEPTTTSIPGALSFSIDTSALATSAARILTPICPDYRAVQTGNQRLAKSAWNQ